MGVVIGDQYWTTGHYLFECDECGFKAEADGSKYKVSGVGLRSYRTWFDWTYCHNCLVKMQQLCAHKAGECGMLSTSWGGVVPYCRAPKEVLKAHRHYVELLLNTGMDRLKLEAQSLRENKRKLELIERFTA